MIFSKKLFRFYFLRICELVYKGVLIFGLAAKRFAGGLENLLSITGAEVGRIQDVKSFFFCIGLLPAV